MTRTPVTSSNVVSVGYDKKQRVLEIEFRGARVYRYEAVPASTARGLLAAASKGKYVWKRIRDRYVFVRG